MSIFRISKGSFSKGNEVVEKVVQRLGAVIEKFLFNFGNSIGLLESLVNESKDSVG